MRSNRQRCQAVAVGSAAAAVLSMISASTAAAASTGQRGPGQHATAATTVTMRAWGLNSFGQLGDGSARDRHKPVKVRLPAGTTVTSVRSGCYHTVALTSTGRVLAWGDNGNGELGNGTVTSSHTAVRVKLPRGVTVTAVRAGCTFSLALAKSGRVLAWGQNSTGELGNGGSTDRHRPAYVKLPPGTRVKAISAGQSFGLALTASGHVFAWGFNESGELGNGSTADSDTPVRVELPSGTRVKSVAAGGGHVLALTTTGLLLGWGLNAFGEVGDGSTTSRDTPVDVMIPAGTKVTGIIAGVFFSLALTSQGRVLAWGDNSNGELGDGSTTASATPVRVRLPAGSRVRVISAGAVDSYALTTKGRVLAWGFGGEGQLGDGGSADHHVPVRVRLASNLTVTALASGPSGYHAFVIVRPRS
jgi:alpha-tubulin suppressor-like RCC1 family protein